MAEVDQRMDLACLDGFANELRLAAASGGCVIANVTPPMCIALAACVDRGLRSSDLDRREAAVKAAEVAVDRQCERLLHLAQSTRVSADRFSRDMLLYSLAVLLLAGLAVLGW